MLLKLVDLYAKLITNVIILLMLILLFSVGLTVVGRYVAFVPSYFWTLEVNRFALIWLVFLGSIVGIRESRHFFIDIYAGGVPLWFETVLKVVYYVVTLSVTYIFIVYGIPFFIDWGTIQTSDLTGINLGYLYVSVPIAGLSWLVFLMEHMYNDIKRGGVPEEHHMADSYTIEHDENESADEGEADR